MKKTFKFLTLTVLLSMVGVLSAFAAEVTDITFVKNGCTYKVIQIEWGPKNSGRSKGTVSVMGNPADQTQTSITIDPSFKEQISGLYGGVERDDSVTFTVTEVLPNAFRGLNKVTNLTIPGTVTTIGEGAFANMTGLTYLKIGTATDKSDLTTLDNFAFGNDPIATLDLSDCPKLDLKSGRPLINAFGQENHRLKTVLLPKEIKEIGTAFAGLDSLKNLDLSKTKVSSLDAGALTGTSIKDITLARPVDPTDATISIGANALPKTLEKLTVLGDLGPDAITAQPGLDKLKELRLHGALQGAKAIPENAFPDSPLEILAIGGRSTNPGDGITVAGAIAPHAFGNKTLKTINFNGPIAEGGISHNAFEGAGACAKVNFNGVLNKNAIGAEAFKSASISELNFKKELKSYAIANNAFEAIVCDANVDFIGKVGDHAVGTAAFTLAQLGSVTFEKALSTDGAIRAEAFKGATLKGDLTFKGAITGYHSIGLHAFQEADLQGNIIFGGDINHDEAIATEAFKDFTNSAAGATPITFKNIYGNKAINESAFEGGAVASVTVKEIKGNNAIAKNAFKGTPMTELTVTGEIRGTEAISEGAFADNAKLGLIDLQGTLVADQGSAIAPGAFANAATETNGGAVLNAGNIIKTPAAIAAGAFAGASLSVVNFKELLVEKAIADNQFNAVGDNLPAASIKTVNFQNELKDWTKEQGASKNFVGNNAFTKTGVSAVNFVKVSTKDAIVVEDDSANPEMGPFAANGAKMTINFNGDVCTGGFGQYAFANSNTTKIVLNNDNEFSKLAFSSKSFLNIALAEGATPGNTKIVTIEYTNPAAGVGVYRAFDVEDFYETLTNVDIKFVTTADVKQMYSTDVNAEDMTPYRLKFFVTKEIEMIKIDDSHYYGFFDPEDEQYIIEKYQENGYDEETWQGPKSHTDAIVGVYSAYSDDQTLVQMQGYNFPATLGGQPLYYADLYLNPLRVQEKGKYVLNQGHTFIITSNKPDAVIATQDDNNMRDGGVQTFAGLTPWACNDLRWNPGRISARYDASGKKINGMFTEGKGCFTKDATGKFEWAGLNAGEYAVKPGHEWDGEVSWMAIEDGDPDYYGNVLRNYQIFVSNPGSYGFEFANAPLIPAKAAYVLVGAYGDTDETKYSVQKQNRINYSGNNIYPVDGLDNGVEDLIERLQSIVDGNPDPDTDRDLVEWIKKTLKAAEKAGYNFRVNGPTADGDTHVSDDAHKEAIVEAFKKIFGEPKQREKLDDDGQPVLDENGEPVMEDYYDLENLANGTTIKDLMTQFNKLCTAKQKVAAQEQLVKDLDKICKDENAPIEIRQLLEEYEKYSKLLEDIEKQKDLAELSKIAITWQDDLYQQYLNFKANPDNVPAETKEKYQELYENFSTLAEAIANYAKAMAWVENDAHAYAYYTEELEWIKKVHGFATLRANRDVLGTPENDYFDVEFAYVRDEDFDRVYEYVDGAYYYQIKVIESTSKVTEAEDNAVPETLYLNDDDKGLYTWDGTNMHPYAINGLFTNAYLTGNSSSEVNYDWDAAPKGFDPSESVEPLYGTTDPDDEDANIDERKYVKALVDAEIVIRNLIGKLGLDYSMDETSLNKSSEVAEELAANASELANYYKDFAWLWYSDQVNESGNYNSGSKEVYTWSIANVNRQAEKELANIASVEEYLTTDACYQSYIAAVNALGKDAKDAVAGTPNTYYTQTVDGIERITFENEEPKIKKAGKVAKAAVKASGLKKGVVTAETALNNFIAGEYNDDVAALAAAINLIDQELTNAYNAGARLNIIWNDRPEEVVGIMEAVVNKKAAAAVKGNAIYNLNGMRVNKAQKGIYIQNGQKVVVK